MFPAGGGNFNGQNGEQQEQQPWYMPSETGVMMIQESCVLKCAMSGVGGFVLGAGFGLFMSSFESQSSYYMHNPSMIDQKVPLKTQLRDAARDMGTKSYSMAKQFATVGAIYGLSECVIEGYRAKHDIVNAVSAGCVTGGVLAIKSGPHAAAFGCAGFAAFSAAIEYFLEGR
ncbi:hypothetical protein MIR68_000873 [Amoeboaphelidium protococcarum]|nr:hypothetical protein MIR68_000873 [Amoeboaphelidium protococcarum]KAI3643647.1 hypothetical protein MP228_009811 [Amoeboaphelidium protococcarum]